MERKLIVWLLVVSLLAGCISQQKPTPTPSPTPEINNPPIADFSYSWTGGDENQPWTCSKIIFKAEVSDSNGDKISLMWHDNNNALFQFMDKSSFEMKLWLDGMHTIKLTATDDKGAKTVVEKQINVKYEVPEPMPVKNKNGLNIATIYVPTGVEPQTHQPYTWLMSQYMPLLGYYDMANPITVDWHIKWALEHGINTLWIGVAPHGDPPEKVGKGGMMIYFRDGFLKAKYKNKIKFNVFLDTRSYNPNSQGFFEPTDSIEKDAEILSTYYFNQGNYYKVKGKPVVYMALSDSYLCDDCKDTKDKKEREELLKSHVKIMRETAKKYGYDLFLIGDLSNLFNEGNGVEEFLIENFDALTSYDMETARDQDKYMWKTDEKVDVF